MKSILTGQAQMEPMEIGDEELAEIGLILEMRRNFSMSVYKDKCMKRRVAIRMRSCHCHDAAAYCNLLRQSEHEIDLLQKTLTIHVSQFFRNPSMFEKLRSDIFPALFENSLQNDSTLRIWSLGCAGGEEAYSLAILLREHFPQQLKHTATVINATDIDQETIQAAQKAEYNEDRLKELPNELRQRYFRHSGPRMLLSQAVRDMVAFHQGDIMAIDEYLPHDLVMCRNTLIYFTRPEQEKILNGVADILPSGGILVLGKSETLVGESRRKFLAVCPTERIYRKI